MNQDVNLLFEELSSKNDEIRLTALTALISMTDHEVDWFENRYSELLSKLSDENSYQRSIGIMLLCNLAKSDKKNELQKVLNTILKHTQDEKFITSRQCIQNIWKIAVAHKDNQNTIVDHLKNRYLTCMEEKHYNLIRQDIIQSLTEIVKITRAEELKNDIINLIQEEKEEKYKDKYSKILKNL